MPTKNAQLCKAILDSGVRAKANISCLQYELQTFDHKEENIKQLEKFLGDVEKESAGIMKDLEKVRLK